VIKCYEGGLLTWRRRQIIICDL